MQPGGAAPRRSACQLATTGQAAAMPCLLLCMPHRMHAAPSLAAGSRPERLLGWGVLEVELLVRAVHRHSAPGREGAWGKERGGWHGQQTKDLGPGCRQRSDRPGTAWLRRLPTGLAACRAPCARAAGSHLPALKPCTPSLVPAAADQCALDGSAMGLHLACHSHVKGKCRLLLRVPAEQIEQLALVPNGCLFRKGNSWVKAR